MLVRNPGVTTIALLSLVLGITLNSVVFSLADGLWLRPMAFAEPERVVRVFASTPQLEREELSYPDYLDLRAQMQSLTGLAVVDRRGASLAGEEVVEMVRADLVSRNFFTVLGIRPHLGQFFSEADPPQLQSAPVVVLNHRLWQRRFGGDTNLPGKSIVISGQNHWVLGIAPPGFPGLERFNPAEVWFPIEARGQYRRDSPRDGRWLDVVGRLKPGCTAQGAQSEAATIFRRLDLRDAATHEPLKARVWPAARWDHANGADTGALLLSIVGLVLLVACANVSGLLLARAEARRAEMAVRIALGGARLRLVRQLLTESLLLAGVAAVLSLLAANWLISVLPALLPWGLAPLDMLVRLDGRVVVFTGLVSLLTVLAFGLAPALRASQPAVLPALKGEVSNGGRPQRYSGLDAVVIGQMSMALLLVAVAALLTRSVWKCYRAELGFEKKDLLLAQLGASGDPKEGRLFYQQVLERVRALPGVKGASLGRVVPFSPSGTGASQKVFVDQGQSSPDSSGWAIRFNSVEPDYFRVLGIPILRGRGFTDRDDLSGPKVMLVNETLAQRFWPGQNPIGKHVRLGSPSGPPTEIVGLLRDGRIDLISERPEPYFYVPLLQEHAFEATLLVESALELTALARSVRQELRRMNITLSNSAMGTLKEYIRSTLRYHEVRAKLLSLFGLLGLGFAAIGLYGVLAQAITRRTREIGIRMAMGARPGDVVKAVLRRGLTLALVGGALGLPLALAAGRLLRSHLYGVSSVDPLSLAAGVVLLLVVALLAAYFPACRAARVDPVVALRYE
jgi:predicted permease